MFKKLYAALVCLLLCTMIFSGCVETVQAADLMEGITQTQTIGKDADETFIAAQMHFAVELFKKTANREKNSLISPLSVQLALAMTANGASGETLCEMETALGGIPIETLNKYLYSYVQSLPSEEKCKLQIASSIWFRDAKGLRVEKNFLQTNADYYGAQAYKSPFNEQTAKDINAWANMHTFGMINKILEKIDPTAMLYLINTVLFDAQWQKPYDEQSIIDGIFNTLSGEKKNVSMMSSVESYYLFDSKAVGFMKNYNDGKYRFAALLPNEDVSLEKYVESLSAETLLTTLETAERNVEVEVKLPKFKYEYKIQMKDALSALGMPLAFNSAAADFFRMGYCDNGKLYVESVLHKTYISVDGMGTRAGAATAVIAAPGSAPIKNEPYRVTLNRPFLYLIVDAQTNLPVFIGTVTDIA